MSRGDGSCYVTNRDRTGGDGRGQSEGSVAAVDAYEDLVRIRCFEQALLDLHSNGLIHGTVHPAIGQEAIAVAFAQAMRTGDYTYASFRGHAHAISRGVPLVAVAAEVLGRRDGTNRGRGGSVHIMSTQHRVMLTPATVGASLPLAVGTAWAAQVRGADDVTVCFFGDGATNTGAFHEALNIAAVWRLAIVFVCENNQFAIGTRTAEVTAVRHPAADRASAYGLHPIVVDGNDVMALMTLASTALTTVRQGNGPLLMEACTYRLGFHSTARRVEDRPDDEVQYWKARDPLLIARRTLSQDGVPVGRIEHAERCAKQSVDDAIAEALQSPPPNASEMTEFLWSP